MAKNKRNRVYKLTPRRKAALKKAQAVSARKRSRRGTVALGAVGATIVAGGAYAGYRGLKGRSGKTNVVSHTTKSVKTTSSPSVSQAPSQVSQSVVPTVVAVTTSTSKELDLIRVAPTKNGKNWRIVGRPFKQTKVQNKVRHVLHDRIWTKNRKEEARRARRAKAERRRYRLRQQANGRWRTK